MRWYLWALGGWLAIIPLAIANGILRESVLTPHLGVHAALPMSGGILMLGIGVVTWLLVGRFGPQPRQRWIALGAAWLAATVIFEIGLGLATGRSWSEMLAPFTFTDNNLMLVVLAWVATAPLAIARWRGLIQWSAARY